MTTALVLFLVIVLLSLLFADQGWSNVLSSSRNDVVFAGRNKAYGAYRIRQEHHRVLVVSLVFAVGLMTTLTIVPRLLATGPVQPPWKPDDRMGTTVILSDDPTEKAQPVKPISNPPKPPSDPDPKYNPNEVPDIVVDSTAEGPRVDTVTTTAAKEPSTGPTGTTPIPPTGGALSGGTHGSSGSGEGGEGPRYKRTWELDEAPEFPGGDAGLSRYFDRTIIYPEISEDRREEGTVWVEFVVDVDGSVTGARIAKGVTKELDAEALRSIRRMPHWKPGLIGDDPVAVLCQQRIVFELEK
ncbi:MAG: energy transducer TonB [Flavobacteriales bacterium]